MIEDAIPINVSQGRTKSAKETFTIQSKKMVNKEEMTKEERR